MFKHKQCLYNMQTIHLYMVSKQKTRQKKRKCGAHELTGHNAEKCEVCGAPAKYLYKMGIFDLLFCPKHYNLWLQGYSIEQMQNKERNSKSRKNTSKKRVNIPIMMCGHRANAVDKSGNPLCAICFPSKESITIMNSSPSFEGRMAKCTYCNNIKPSSYDLPFFTPMPNRPYDDFYCGCRGWD